MKNNKSIEAKILCFCGIAIFIFGLLIFRHFLKTASWKSTEGVIIGSYIRDLPVPEAKTHNNLTPDIVYEYRVNNKTYFSNKISYIDMDFFPKMSDNYYAGNYDEVKDFLSNYPVGQKVTVYYNPANPAQAILDRGTKMPIFLPMLIGMLMIYISFHFYVFSSVLPKDKEPMNISNAQKGIQSKI